MASEILGLFGKTPAQIRQEQFDSMMVSPTQMGSQGLLQQVVSMGRNAGSAAGGMAGRMMGGMAPGEREAMVMQDVMQRVGQDPNMTQAERLRKMAEIVSQQPGMGDQALKLQAAANQMETQQLKIADARFNQDNRYADRKETRMVPNPNGLGGVVPKQFYWTEKYNKETGKWERMTTPSDTPPPAGGGGGENKSALDLEAERRAKEKAGKPQGGGGGERVGEAASPDFTGRAGFKNVREQAEKQKAADNQAQQELDQENERLLRRSTPSFKTLAEKEAALKAAVKAGNYGLAGQINKQPPFRKY